MKRKLMEKVMRGERRKDYSRAKSGTNLRRGQRIRFKRWKSKKIMKGEVKFIKNNMPSNIDSTDEFMKT